MGKKEFNVSVGNVYRSRKDLLRLPVGTKLVDAYHQEWLRVEGGLIYLGDSLQKLWDIRTNGYLGNRGTWWAEFTVTSLPEEPEVEPVQDTELEKLRLQNAQQAVLLGWYEQELQEAQTKLEQVASVLGFEVES